MNRLSGVVNMGSNALYRIKSTINFNESNSIYDFTDGKVFEAIKHMPDTKNKESVYFGKKINLLMMNNKFSTSTREFF